MSWHGNVRLGLQGISQTQICEPPVSVIAFHYLIAMAFAGGHEGRLEG